MSYDQRWFSNNREKILENYSFVNSIYSDQSLIENEDVQLDESKEYEENEENLYYREKAEIRKEFKEKIDPYHSANIFSKIFFYWAFKIIKLSNRIKIQNDHFGKLSENNQSIYFSSNFKNFWKEKYSNNKEKGIFKAMVAFNLSKLIYSCFLWGILVIFEFFDVYLFREFIKTFASNTPENIKKSIIVAGIYFSLKFINEILSRYIWFYMVDLGLQTRYQLQGLAYDKLLKLTPASKNQKISDGRIINTIIEDTDKFRVLVHGLNDLVFWPLKIIFYCVMLILHFGLSAVFGILVILISILINYFVFISNSKLLTQKKLKKDSRIECANETLSNIKILKLYAWEKMYPKKIQKEREQELTFVEKCFKVNSLNILNLNMLPVLISIVILGVYQFRENKMEVDSVMTGMYIFNLLRNAFRNIPFYSEQAANAFVSFKRTNEFLNLDEVDKRNDIIQNEAEVDDSFCYNLHVDNKNNINETSMISLNMSMHDNSYINLKHHNDDFYKNNQSFDNDNFNQNVVIRVPNLSFSWGKTDEIKDAHIINMTIDVSRRDKNLSKDYDFFRKILEEEEEVENLGDENYYPKLDNFPTTLKNIKLKVEKGELIGIFGKIGSGKTSLIQAILNNMIPINHHLSKNDKFYSDKDVIVRGSIAYSSQIPWIENATLKENILFQSEFDSVKYQEVIRLCELESDLKQLPAGDLTEIGEKGVNLSGGQKARVSLARAVYSDRDIIILDDPLSALDAQVGEKIMKNLICGHLSGKTRILITHALHVLEHCDKILQMKDGMIAWAGNSQSLKNSTFFKKILMSLNLKRQIEEEEEMSRKNSIMYHLEESLPKMKSEAKENQKQMRISDESLLANNTAISDISANSEETLSILGSVKNTSDEVKNKIHKIISAEDRGIGRVSLSVYTNYAKHLGGFFLMLLIILLLVGWQILKVFSDKWLIYWVYHNSDENKWKNLGIYFAFGFSSLVLMYISILIIYSRSIECSKSLHNSLMAKLIKAPICTFHETIPLGRIMNRLANDLGSVDTELANRLITFLSFFSTLIGVFIICGFYFPISFTLLPVLLLVGYFISRFSDHCNRELNRLLQISVSPISQMTLETVSGTQVIRAFGFEDKFIIKFHSKLDTHYQIHLFASAVGAWFHLMIGMISSLLLAMFLVFAVYFREKFNEGTVALILTYSILFYSNVFQTLFSMRNFEIDLIKMERCLSFMKIPTEGKMVMKNDKELFDSNENSQDDSESIRYTSNDPKPSTWPKEGTIEFKGYSVRYRPDTNIVLKNLNFKIASGEKVGVIGRTGSGKSTLCLSIFRILEADSGSILIDGVDIKKIGLRTLRSSLTIIPQDPRLMSGTLRSNIDPLEAYSDEKIKEIMEILKICYLLENPSGLNLAVSDAGTSLSIGERQLICIARALLKNSKIVIMDEATANIDFQTEQAIQNALTVLLKSATVLTIAHRIKTIVNCDKILILSKGKVKEFNSPENLLKNKNSLYSKLIRKARLI